MANKFPVVVDVDGFRVLQQGDVLAVPLNSPHAVGSNVAIGGTMANHFTDLASVSTNGTEDDLYSDTIPADLFATNGDKIEASYFVNFVASATATRRFRAYFNGNLIVDSGTLTLASGGSAHLDIAITRESGISALSPVRVLSRLILGGITLQPIVTYTRITTIVFKNPNILKITGTAAGTGAAAADIVAVHGTIKFFPSGN